MGLRKSDIEQIVLVGGAARLYLVPRVLQQIFGSSVSVVYGDPPERTVVRGVALWPVRTQKENTIVPIKKVSPINEIKEQPSSGVKNFYNPSNDPFDNFENEGKKSAESPTQSSKSSELIW